MPLVKCLLKPVLLSLFVLLLGTGFVVAEEIDDASIYVEAFTSYQNKDYLLAIEKIRILRQFFPDSPLQDVTLLLLAHAGLKSGDYELAAKSVNTFNRDYSSSPLKASIEEELLSLGSRTLRGERLPPNKLLRAAAQAIRNERLAFDQTVALAVEQERPPVTVVDSTRMVREKAEAERRVQELLVAEENARKSIKATISIISNDQKVEVGTIGLINFEVANQGTSSEGFMLQVIAPVEYGASLLGKDKKPEPASHVTIATNLPYKGTLSYRMPGDKVDGHKGTITLRATSARFSNIVHTSEARFTAAGPLLRIVARPSNQTVRPGEKTRFRITLLNAGSLPARALSIRVDLPPQTDFLDAPGIKYRQDVPGVVTFEVKSIEAGTLQEFGIDVNVRDDCRNGQELRSRIEVVNKQQKIRETYTSTAAIVETP